MAGVLLGLTLCGSLWAQDWKSNPRDLIRRAVQNENNQPSKKMYFMYRDLKRNSKNGQTETRVMLQTPEMALARIVAINGHPLSAEDKAAVVKYLTRSPLFKYWTYEIDELFMVDGLHYRLPVVQLN